MESKDPFKRQDIELYNAIYKAWQKQVKYELLPNDKKEEWKEKLYTIQGNNINLKSLYSFVYKYFDEKEVKEIMNKGSKFLETSDKEKIQREKEEQDKIWKKVEEDKPDSDIFTRRGQLNAFYKEQPFYYDVAKIFWLWDKQEYKWVLSDEIDFCNLLFEKLGVETINSRVRGEIIEGFKQIGRKNKPKEMEDSWVQFKDKIYDVKTGEIIEASPDFFVTNPIPYKVGKSEETPIINKLFNDWVDPEFVPTLYEIIAYNLSQKKFMQRLFAFIGGGSNGKGTFIKLNYKFLGEDNCVSSEIKSLSEDKFEPAVLFRKLLVVLGEVSYDDLKNTNQLKKLGGEDKLSFQFKGKTPFTADNTATCICLTNSLPITPDKSIGFYRKWLIIDFPNQFKQIKEDLIEGIPEYEFENLAFKSLRILKELYKKQTFTNEGNFKERARRYEIRSNPVMDFVSNHCSEKIGEMIGLRDFTNVCNDFLKDKHLRILNPHQVGKILRESGFIVGHRKIEGISAVVILHLSLNKEKIDINTTITTISPIRKLRKETNTTSSSLGSFNNQKTPSTIIQKHNTSIPNNTTNIHKQKLNQPFDSPKHKKEIIKIIKELAKSNDSDNAETIIVVKIIKERTNLSEKKINELIDEMKWKSNEIMEIRSGFLTIL